MVEYPTGPHTKVTIDPTSAKQFPHNAFDISDSVETHAGSDEFSGEIDTWHLTEFIQIPIVLVSVAQ